FSFDRAIDTIEKNKELMRQMIHIAEVKYTTGKGLQHDVLRAQVELSKLEDDLILWRQKRHSAEARLNALLDRPQGSAVEKIPETIDLPQEEVTAISADLLEERRPLLKAWQLRLHKGESAVKLARKDFWPNITIGASYNQRDTLKSGMTMYDFFSTTVSMNIPLFSKRKQKAKIAERQLSVKAMEAEYESVRSNVLAEIESLRAELDRNRKRVELYRGGILIQAQQSLDSAQSGYQVNKVDFLTLINNWMMLLKYELQYHFALSDYFKSLAGFDLAVGQEIN
ncbi:TolC family protein, partial [Acidobacteriota bacterium]